MSGAGKSREHGAEAFRRRYAELYGARWEGLEAALRRPADSVAYRVRPDCEPYYLDSASIFAAESLDLSRAGEGAPVLDACAAPGGKTLVLASRLPEGARFEANELSADRRRRLAAALERHLPADLRERVDVRGGDAASLCRRRPEAFGAVLLDAPCSSERHVMADSAALADWSPARSRQLAQRQWALLSSAFLMLAPGGCLVYSTCSLDPAENDGVAARLEDKYRGLFRFDPPSRPGGEATAFGTLVLPDASRGAGPMYVCRIRKN